MAEELLQPPREGEPSEQAANAGGTQGAESMPFPEWEVIRLNSLHGLPKLLLLISPYTSSTWTLQRQLQQQDLMKIKMCQREALLSWSFYLVAPF